MNIKYELICLRQDNLCYMEGFVVNTWGLCLRQRDEEAINQTYRVTILWALQILHKIKYISSPASYTDVYVVGCLMKVYLFNLIVSLFPVHNQCDGFALQLGITEF